MKFIIVDDDDATARFMFWAALGAVAAECLLIVGATLWSAFA